MLYHSVFFLFISPCLTVHSLPQCPKCGPMTVPYPLSTGKNCGHPSYPVNCTAQQHLELMGLSGSYRIVSIQPKKSALIIQTGAFIGSSCITEDSLYGNFSLDQGQPFSLTARNTVMLFNCSRSLLFSPLHCGPASACQKVIETRAQNCRQTELCCSFSTMTFFSHSFPISGQETAYVGVIDLNATEAPDKWKYGLQIEWSVPTEPPCRVQADCEANSSCLKSATRNRSSCLCDDGYEWDPFSGTCPKAPLCSWKSGSMRCHKKAYATGLACGLVGTILVFMTVFIACRRRKAEKQSRAKLVRERSLILAANSGGKSAKLFSSRDMRKATNGFSKDRILGSGGFGEVYKGILEDGTVVAIKTAKMGNITGTEQVLNEVRILSQVNHRNLVRLLGCCVEHEQPLMVYEYVPNGNLFEHLSGARGHHLDWKTRLHIAYQSAEGIAYLHSAAYPPIYHRDIKSCNILLDKTLNARVADFGLSRLAEPDLTHVSTCAQGTLGYLDPEYYRNYQLTDKSDVYSFGVVLLELVTSQKAIDFGRGQDEVNLAVLVQAKAEAETVEEVWDAELVAGASKARLESMRGVTMLALDCVLESRGERPTMKEVAEQLNYYMIMLENAAERKCEEF